MHLHSNIDLVEVLRVAYIQESNRDLKMIEVDFFVQDYQKDNYYVLVPNVYGKD